MTNDQGKDMAETYDWSSFYEALCHHGPNLLLGIDDDVREIIKAWASSTDMFWSDGLQELLVEGATDGNMRAGVLSVLELWRENVLETLDADFGIELDWQNVSFDAASPLILELIEAASPGNPGTLR
ncbi:MAG: hypothetical protein U9R58_10810 [Chloroflexota bacterium]|nr:hypothetical protein [Chloroflexota bacterium]